MLSGVTSTPLEDVEFLARSDHRVAALESLTSGPRSRAELRETTGVSQSTIGRTLREFEARHWVRRDGHRYEATQLGAFVATGLRELIERLETERQLRDIWQWLPIEASGFAIEMCADAVVTVAETDDPYRPVNRFVSLLRETDRFRFVGFDLALLEPCKDELARRIVDGMRTEIIDPPSVARHVLSTYPEHCAEPLESGHLEIRLHDDLPSYGVAIFDHRIGISGYNPESGTVRVLVDTDAPAAREWAKSTYERYRRESRPLALEPTVD
ncbi:helix-turn-helix transcriptional regulator [Natrinema salaciae]|uniref:Predicted transcriptional regulator, contains HTH domain n=1 Tax=Natrinema salaciae TaxID=1186196 RepID=A0A1H9RG68_9EURY|nr:MarR family transcriptional regulator [Natrinema salaciae]SER71627.1 Predicted transcriptional regulator, contains HTH domain [Natrinema salaciae]